MRFVLLLSVLSLGLPFGVQAKVLMVGDSLAVGTRPYLEVETYAKISLSLEAGMRVWRSYPTQQISAFSLFTNNHPGQIRQLEEAVKESMKRSKCVVWATIQRPPVGGISYGAANQRLRTLAQTSSKLKLVDWKALTDRSPELLAGDKIHATSEGYRIRASLYRQAIAKCGSRTQNPPPSSYPPPVLTPSPQPLSRAQELRRSLKRQALKQEKDHLSGGSKTSKISKHSKDRSLKLPIGLESFIQKTRYWLNLARAPSLIRSFYLLVYGSYN